MSQKPDTNSPLDWQYIAERRRIRVADLEREVQFLAAERRRYERLLGMALRVAAGSEADPLVLLQVIAAYCAVDLARPAFMEERPD